MAFEKFKGNPALYRQIAALQEKMRECEISPFEHVRRRRWKILGKIKRIEDVIANRQLPLWSGRL